MRSDVEAAVTRAGGSSLIEEPLFLAESIFAKALSLPCAKAGSARCRTQPRPRINASNSSDENANSGRKNPSLKQ